MPWKIKQSSKEQRYLFICLFVCLRFCVQVANFSVIQRRYYFRWRAANFDIYFTLNPIEQWGFLVCHTYSDKGYTSIMVIRENPWSSHLVAERSVMELPLFVLKDVNLSRLGFETNPSACKSNSLRDCASAAGKHFFNMKVTFWHKFNSQNACNELSIWNMFQLA